MRHRDHRYRQRRFGLGLSSDVAERRMLFGAWWYILYYSKHNCVLMPGSGYKSNGTLLGDLSRCRETLRTILYWPQLKIIDSS